MKIDLKVPCSIDMSDIYQQMAVVDKKKAELKQAIDDLASRTVEVVLRNKPESQILTNKFYLVDDDPDNEPELVGPVPVKKKRHKPSTGTNMTEIKKEFLKTFDTVESNSPIADLYRHYNGKEMGILLEEIWNISFRFFNERLGQQTKMPSFLDFKTALKEASADILDHRDLNMVQEVWNVVLALFSGREYAEVAKPMPNVPDFPKWRDMLEEKNADIYDTLTEEALEEVYYLSKDFFQPIPKAIKFPSFEHFYKTGSDLYEVFDESEKQPLQQIYDHFVYMMKKINK